MDEIDAFPYKDNPLLIEMFKRSVNGNYILMSATPSRSVLEEFSKKDHDILTLFTRYHAIGQICFLECIHVLLKEVV